MQEDQCDSTRAVVDSTVGGDACDSYEPRQSPSRAEKPRKKPTSDLR